MYNVVIRASLTSDIVNLELCYFFYAIFTWAIFT